MPALRGADLMEALLLRMPAEDWDRARLARIAETGETGDPHFDALLDEIEAGTADRAYRARQEAAG